ncbi:glycosyltransferase [Vibrio methylphosphonaticus]|uniref:glycosyltransferase n=1 Tax=Vibrio methylphosphonaticus TaxID=2946866 RepID=UPI002029DF86|nr:glycosyltransferase [Vibrio methylphosphonaticus]MCL9775542.1 glycosyltransferase [Vibrio methylphosphonaticus]
MKLAVIMSTYNGSKYISEQLDSILSCNWPGKKIIYIRDDGSSDATAAILLDYARRYPENIKVELGQNLGPALSFLTKLTEIDGYDYYCFADQDDVWLEDKLLKAESCLSSLNERGTPALYCSRLQNVDHELKFLSMSPKLGELDLPNTLCEASVAGCTMFFNERLKHFVSMSLPVVQKYGVMMHDTWIVYIAGITGNIIADEHSYILYRQHENNVVGAKRSLFKKITSIRKNINASIYQNSIIDEAVKLEKLSFFDDYESSRAIVSKMRLLDSDILTRIKISLWGPFYRKTFFSNFTFKFMVILGLYKKHIK